MVFGVPLMPSVLLNGALSLLRDRSLPVIAPDRVAVFAPMYNEGEGARACLLSLLGQTEPPDEIVLSVNGGSDDTHEIVVATLAEAGYTPSDREPDGAFEALVCSWDHPDAGCPVTVILRRSRTSKSDSLNDASLHGLLRADRILVTDGDTVFDARFVERLRRHFYRLTFVGRGASRRAVIENVALQSGNVTSFTPEGAGAAARWISSARRAEYAFGSVLRRGQVTRRGDGALFGRSRLFTVVGCGFAVRRDALPLSAVTKTEDHDLTLRSQTRPDVRTSRRVRALDALGFRVIRGASCVPLSEVIGDERLEFRTSGSARFVGDALMKTQDPPHLDGYLNQVERWHGGAQQNVLHRLGLRLGPNVAFTMWAAVLENLIGIALMAALLAAVGVNLGNPSLGIAPRVLALAVAIDVAAAALFITLGLYRYHRAHERRRPALLAMWQSIVGALPYATLRYLGPVIYLASALQVIPEHARRRRRSAHAGVAAWERPTLRVRTLSHALLPIGLVGFAAGMTTLAWFAPSLNPINDEAWRLTYEREPIDLDAHASLTILLPYGGAGSPHPQLAFHGTRSLYCEPELTGRAPLGRGERFGAAGDADLYAPLSGWELVALLRLVPLIGYVDSALHAYGVPGNLFLRVLINESYLDPLAVGVTDDHGLSQQNADSLTMLRALSNDVRDPLYNPHLFAAPFSVYDPDFSTCAGAAKLAWAMRQRDAVSDEHAYALYINPITGVRDGAISDVHAELTAVMMRLATLVDRIESTFAAYAADERDLARRDREAVAIAAAVRDGGLSLEGAYRGAYDLVVRHGLPDAPHYQRLLGGTFTAGRSVSR